MNCKSELRYSVGGVERSVGVAGCGDIRLTVKDNGSRRTVAAVAARDIELISYRETEHDFFTVGRTDDPKGDLYFINGYQSWTDTREYYGDARERDVTALPRRVVSRFSLDRYGDATFYEYDKKILHGYDVFYVKGESNGFILNLNRENAYLIAEVVRRLGAVTLISDVAGKRLRAGESFTVCDYAYAGSFEDGKKLLDEHYPERPIKKLLGYTSWYNYYQDINEDIILRDLEALDGRFDLFQIDDGYETYVGDWLDVDEKKFPNGLGPIVERIHAEGYSAGIWLAPFAAETKSRTFREHPDWFKREKNGKPYKCGSNWSGFYGLDLDNEEVLGYIEKCLRHYADMGFDFFKLDFLYAANLPEYEGITRSQAAEKAYAFLRKVLGDKLILGCGATLSNAIGRFDYLRVGPDVSLSFDDVWYMRYMHRERISTKVTLQNTIFRSFTDGRFFGNDPDVFLLRDDNISLTPQQRRALITINALFGSVMMTSDNIAEYDDEKKKLLSDSLRLFREAKVTGYSRRDTVITAEYSLDGEIHKISYDAEKGVLI
ncbi:MAG: alpha-galactosidase [Clostridia bacterium]|nr:alpha-galactosidase [Clostridia bacterium]